MFGAVGRVLAVGVTADVVRRFTDYVAELFVGERPSRRQLVDAAPGFVTRVYGTGSSGPDASEVSRLSGIIVNRHLRNVGAVKDMLEGPTLPVLKRAKHRDSNILAPGDDEEERDVLLSRRSVPPVDASAAGAGAPSVADAVPAVPPVALEDRRLDGGGNDFVEQDDVPLYMPPALPRTFKNVYFSRGHRSFGLGRFALEINAGGPTISQFYPCLPRVSFMSPVWTIPDNEGMDSFDLVALCVSGPMYRDSLCGQTFSLFYDDTVLEYPGADFRPRLFAAESLLPRVGALGADVSCMCVNQQRVSLSASSFDSFITGAPTAGHYDQDFQSARGFYYSTGAKSNFLGCPFWLTQIQSQNPLVPTNLQAFWPDVYMGLYLQFTLQLSAAWLKPVSPFATGAASKVERSSLAKIPNLGGFYALRESDTLKNYTFNQRRVFRSVFRFLVCCMDATNQPIPPSYSELVADFTDIYSPLLPTSFSSVNVVYQKYFEVGCSGDETKTEQFTVPLHDALLRMSPMDTTDPVVYRPVGRHYFMLCVSMVPGIPATLRVSETSASASLRLVAATTAATTALDVTPDCVFPPVCETSFYFRYENQ